MGAIGVGKTVVWKSKRSGPTEGMGGDPDLSPDLDLRRRRARLTRYSVTRVK